MTRLSGYQGTRHMSPQAARQETDRGGHYRHLPLAYLQPLGERPLWSLVGRVTSLHEEVRLAGWTAVAGSGRHEECCSSLCDDRIAACDFAPVTACPAAARSKQRSGNAMNPCIRH